MPDKRISAKKMTKKVADGNIILYEAKTSDSRKIYWGLNNEDTAHSITASYAENKEPKNSSEYKTLHDIIVNLGSGDIVVQYAAQLVSLVA